ncbi:MAG: acyl carrier protein [Gammaproteobacteria bacterium]|nr:acyl carrier protein [Gammaproteobacteria bacterium]
MDKNSMRQLIASYAKLNSDISELNDDSNLFDAGLTSLNTVNLMLAIEDEFDIEFDDDSLRRETFQSVDALTAVVSDLLQTA